MSKQILIDSYFGLVRTAISEGSTLLDYYEESPEQGRSKGNVYRGVVKKIDAPIQAAFVRYGAGRDGFLPLRDAGPDNKAPKVGDTVLVQVVKDEVDHKGAALTTKISLSGRYLVYIPGGESHGGISSRILDEERAALKKVLGELQIPEGGSIILRTAALNKAAPELQADLDRLTEIHREITEQSAVSKEPALLFHEAPPALRYLREYYTPDVDRIWVNQEDVLSQCREFFYLYEPKSAAKVVLSQDGPLMFQKLGLEAEVEHLTTRKVGLPSGANIVIDQAEALVAIDVNSAKAGNRGEEAKGKGDKGRGKRDRGDRGERGRPDLEATAFAVNREAAVEIARQLRLRDLGGIVIVDFIDMEEEKHRRQIEETMRKALAADKAKVKIFDISPLGIMQISRQRLRKAGPNFSRQACEDCQGRGWHPSPEAGALGLLRKMEEKLFGKKPGQAMAVSAPYPVANALLNDFREHLSSMESRFACTLRITAMPSASGDAVFAPTLVATSGEKGRNSGKGREAAEPKARARVERGDSQQGNVRTQTVAKPHGPGDPAAAGPDASAGRSQSGNRSRGRGGDEGRNPSVSGGERNQDRGQDRNQDRGQERNQARGQDRNQGHSQDRNSGRNQGRDGNRNGRNDGRDGNVNSGRNAVPDGKGNQARPSGREAERNGRHGGRDGRRNDGRGNRESAPGVSGGADRARLIAEGIIRAADARESDPRKDQSVPAEAMPAQERIQRSAGSDAPQSEIVRVALEQARKLAQAANAEAHMKVEAIVIAQEAAPSPTAPVKAVQRPKRPETAKASGPAAAGAAAPGKRRPAKAPGRAVEQVAPSAAKTAAKTPVARRRKADPETTTAASKPSSAAGASAPTRKPRAKAVRVPS